MKEEICCLLVDDDIDDHEIFTMALQTVNKHVKCIVANNGAEALTLLDADKNLIPEYIFLDVNMPKMNGIECLKNIKLQERLKSSRIYMYSTTSEDHVVSKTKELGAVDFIIKPARSSELRVILSRIFNNNTQFNASALQLNDR